MNHQITQEGYAFCLYFDGELVLTSSDRYDCEQVAARARAAQLSSHTEVWETCEDCGLRQDRLVCDRVTHRTNPPRSVVLSTCNGRVRSVRMVVWTRGDGESSIHFHSLL